MKMWSIAFAVTLAVVVGALWWGLHRSKPATAPATAAASAGPGLSAADEAQLLESYNKAVSAQTAFTDARDAYQALAKQMAKDRGFPDGTGFAITVEDCKPSQGGGVACRQVVRPQVPAPQQTQANPGVVNAPAAAGKGGVKP